MSIKLHPAKMLLDYENTVNRLQNQDPGLYMILFKTIRQWYNDNGIRLDTLKEKIKKLYEEFLEFEGEKETYKIKLVTKDPIPAVPAKYETKIVRKGNWFRKEITEQVLISAEVPEQKFPPMPVFMPDKTEEELNKRYDALVNALVEIKY